MITIQEYPATHSMSTAWYVADEEGNVAIMNYNDNGPVPWCTEQTCIENLVFGHKEDDRKDFLPINLTDDQVLELIENPKDPDDNEESWWFWETVVQIDKTQEKEFLTLIKNPDVVSKHCISKSLGLYMLDCHGCFQDKREATHKHPLKSSSLYKMLASNMILKLYMPKDYFINDEWKDDHMEYEHTIGTSPYYIYAQPYWNALLADRIIIPKNPVKLSQLPASLQKRVHRVPLRFSDCKQFQIAEWVPCDFTRDRDEEKHIDGCIYGLLPLTDGSKAYVLESYDVDFYDYCSEKEIYHCKECSSHCAKSDARFFTDKPTIMIIVSPYSKFDYDMYITSDVIIKNCVMMPFLPKIPKPVSCYYAFIDDAKKSVTPKMLEELFLKNNRYLEDMLVRYNPRMVIIDEEAWPVLKKRYSLSNGKLEIRDKSFAIYKVSEVEINRKEIERLSELPYQGTVFRHIISIEEMQKIEEKKND